MRKLLSYFICALAAFALTSCYGDRTGGRSPYGVLRTLTVTLEYSDSKVNFDGSEIKIEEINTGAHYSAACNALSRATVEVPAGLYRVRASIQKHEYEGGEMATYSYNALAEKVLVLDTQSPTKVNLALKRSRSGEIVIKEIYCGGCNAFPSDGRYAYDKYVILHNNSNKTVYLDSLCFGALDPYNAIATNKWVKKDAETGETIFQDFAPVIQAIWMFGGDGTSHPLEPGQDAVLSIFGAVDHTIQYPYSVNLNNEGYYVLYDETLFPNPAYHPAPGDKIQNDHILECVIKMGQANAYAFSQNSPAVVIFRAKGTSISNFVAQPEHVIQVPGSTSDKVVTLPWEWIEDAVEVFTAGTANLKRLSPLVDAGYVVLSDTGLGHTLMRRVDADASASAGYEILTDTNNSSEDMYERETQSLHKDEK